MRIAHRWTPFLTALLAACGDPAPAPGADATSAADSAGDATTVASTDADSGGGGGDDSAATQVETSADTSADTSGSAIAGSGTIVLHESGTETYSIGSYSFDDQVTASVVYGASTVTTIPPYITRIDITLSHTNLFAATCGGHEDLTGPVITETYDVDATSSETSHNPGVAGDQAEDAPAGRLTLIRTTTTGHDVYTYDLQLAVAAARVTTWSSTLDYTQQCGASGPTHEVTTDTPTTSTKSSSLCGGAATEESQDDEKSVTITEDYQFLQGEFDPSSGFIDVSDDSGSSDQCGHHLCTPGGVPKTQTFELATCHTSIGGSVHLPVDAAWLR